MMGPKHDIAVHIGRGIKFENLDGEKEIDKKPFLDTRSQLLDTGPLAITGPGLEQWGLDTEQHVNNTHSP
eukprot:1754104-Rhodomonas_salina.1